MHPDDNTLAQLVDGALDDATRTEIERHLDGCGTCSELVSALAWVVAPSRDAPPGYRLTKELDARTWEAVELAGEGRRVALGFGGPWPALLPAVRHPNVATVDAVGSLGDTHYIVHALGTRTARQWRADAARSDDEIIAVWCAALAGLAALHARGIVHGRVSPDHVFVEADGRVVVGAFARELGKTSGYVAPEVLAGGPPTAASDQFAACASLWEALAGAKPFRGATAGALAVVMSTPLELPATGARRVFGVLARGLAADATGRWPSTEVLAQALARSRRPRWGLAIAVVLVAITALAVLAMR